MTTIYKYPVDFHQGDNGVCRTEIILPSFYEFLDIQYQNNQMVMWTQIDTNTTSKTTLRLILVGTGWVVNSEEFESYKYLKTLQASNGLVWHIFKEK